MTNFGRIKIAMIALQNIDNVVRIQTDSITFDSPIVLNIINFAIDGKQCGKFHIKNRKVMEKVE